MKKIVLILLLSVVFCSCSKDDGAETVPPQSLTYNLDNVLVINATNTNITPSLSGGPVSNYTITPELPAGLSLDPTTGVISGIPTVVSPATTYVVTASNSAGHTTFDISIAVNDVPPTALSYIVQNISFVRNTAVAELIPTSSGGAVIAYRITPALPAGLSFNTTTGVISGTPTVAATSATYRITAINSGGETSFDVVITVNDSPILRIKEISTFDTLTGKTDYVTYTYQNGLVSLETISRDNGYYGAMVRYYYGNGKIISRAEASRIYWSGVPVGWSAFTNYNCTYTGDFITAINDSSGTAVRTYSYDSFGHVISFVYAFGAVNNTYNYEYHSDGNLFRETITNSGGTNVNTYPIYDNKNNPYRLGGFTPEYLAMNVVPFNNPTAKNNETYIYEYNTYDYPTKKTTYVGGVVVKLTTYTYE